MRQPKLENFGKKMVVFYIKTAEIRLANMLANSTVEDKVVTDFRHNLMQRNRTANEIEVANKLNAERLERAK